MHICNRWRITFRQLVLCQIVQSKILKLKCKEIFVLALVFVMVVTLLASCISQLETKLSLTDAFLGK